MKLELKEFQTIASNKLVELANLAFGEVEKVQNQQAIVLSAPTGAGKTVVAADVMERIAKGDATNPPHPEATFLWLTDQPELNEQTRKKLESASDVFTEDRLITVEASSFDQPTFDAGNVYFLNTQKLGVNSALVSKGNHRQSTIWETIANTARVKGSEFWLVIDEAHRGMTGGKDVSEENMTLVQKLIKGASDVGVPPIPLILGISATPERFNNILKNTDRMLRPYSVDLEKVRESGLLKDEITLFHTEVDQPSDLTLLTAAAERLDRFEQTWQTYTERENADEVKPVLVVQVQDGTKNEPTKTPIEDVVLTLQKALPTLDVSQIAHCFDTHLPYKVNGFTIPYVDPSDIQGDPNIRVVLFKMALSTGWDCPRAEVMMSFRAAKDGTSIAQLVGRMVRTPLARRVSGETLLGSVSLFLPYYDRAELEEVVKRLVEPDAENGIPGVGVTFGSEQSILKRDPKKQKLFEEIERLELPHFIVETVAKQGGARRLLELGRRLGWDGVDDGALERFEDALVTKLNDERKRLQKDSGFVRKIEEAGKVKVRAVGVDLGTESISSDVTSEFDVVEENVEDAFEEAGRKLGGGLHSIYARKRSKERGMDASKLPYIKREVFVLLQDSDVLAAVNQAGDEICKEELTKYRAEINGLPEDKRQTYRRVRQTSSSPSEEPWEPPLDMEGSASGTALKKHLFVKPDGSDFTYREKELNSWEIPAIEAAIADPNVEGWIRNFDRKAWSFSLPYEVNLEEKPMYPDFLVFRREGKALVCDVIEPHALSNADSPAKAQGLAKFAQVHGEKYGRIEFVIKEGETLVRLDVNDPETRTKVGNVVTTEQLKQLFDEQAVKGW